MLLERLDVDVLEVSRRAATFEDLAFDPGDENICFHLLDDRVYRPCMMCCALRVCRTKQVEISIDSEH